MTGWTCTRCGGTDFKVITYVITKEHEGIVCMFCNDDLKRTKRERAPWTGLAAHPSERSVVYFNPKDGHIVYPPRNDQPLPDRYRRQGYERHELPNLRSIERLEKAYGVTSEIAHWDHNSSTRKVDE